MKVSKLALAASLMAIGTTAFLATGPADAQRAGKQRTQQERPQRDAPGAVQLSAEERAAILPLQTAVQAQDWAAAAAALPAAQAAAQSPESRYMVARFQLQIGQGTNDQAVQTQAVDALLASGGAPSEAIQTLVGARATFAIQAQDWPTAEQMLTRFLEAEPNDNERLRQLAEVKIRLNKNAEALSLYQRLLAASEAGGQTAPEATYRRTADLLLDQRQNDAWLTLSQRLLRAYPTEENWSNTLSRYRQQVGDDPALVLDVRRLMRAARAFSRASEYIEFADRLGRAGLPGEQKALLEEGIGRGTVPASDLTVREMLASANARIADDRPTLERARTQALAGTGRQARTTADAYFGYGQYAQAAELYRAALQKGGEDAGMVNTRLGVALAMAGQRAEAEAAFRAVTGTHATLANLWLAWLERRQG